jgi:ferric-dicitrate binding protein FerR (iron transport regulator)
MASLLDRNAEADPDYPAAFAAAIDGLAGKRVLEQGEATGTRICVGDWTVQAGIGSFRVRDADGHLRAACKDGAVMVIDGDGEKHRMTLDEFAASGPATMLAKREPSEEAELDSAPALAR